MSAEKWNSMEVITEPLRVVFFYECGNAKGASIDVINQSEWDYIALAQGQTLPENRPFLTNEETMAAKRAIAERGFHIG